ncbi:MAG: photosystem II protein Y, partial [Microcoleus sp. SIO2G3]|nr:photosystem II protein Y [Microcoleus sp. SIO2G3]
MRRFHKSLREEPKMDFDWRVVAVLAPVIVAAS